MRGEIPARVPLSVRFTPPKPGKFRATFLFRVAKGFPRTKVEDLKTS